MNNKDAIVMFRLGEMTLDAIIASEESRISLTGKGLKEEPHAPHSASGYIQNCR